MGGFTLWCGFCGGPFENAREGWLEAVEDWAVPNEKELSFTPPPAPTEDIVTISQEDGLFWSDVVCVGRIWDNYVSPRGTVEDKFGTIAFPDYSIEPEDDGENPRLIIHPQCLSFLCRRINASPEQIWNSIYGHDSASFNTQVPDGLLDDLEYYDIDKFHDEYYYYCIFRMTPKKGGGKGYDHWKDPDSMKELRWLLARPTVFPVVSSLSPSIAFGTSSVISQAPCMGVFNVSELFDIIIDCIMGEAISQAQLSEELKSNKTFTLSSVIQSTKTILNLLQVTKSLYTTILRDRQTIFLRLAWMHGWMLPFTPQDWNNWPNGTFHNGTVFNVGKNQDWRTYLLTFLRKNDVHVRNRWRFHKMAVQFGRGQSMGKLRWRSEVGDLGFRPDVTSPEPWFWEDGEGEDGEDVDDDRRTVKKATAKKTKAKKSTTKKTTAKKTTAKKT